jgi:hypothetical protein
MIALAASPGRASNSTRDPSSVPNIVPLPDENVAAIQRSMR